MAVDLENWRQSDINVDSLWLFSSRDNSGKHANVYHGNFIPQVPHQLVSRYTRAGDVVMDLFMGSGTTLFECERLGRNFIGYDINQNIIAYVRDKMTDDTTIGYCLCECDVTDEAAFNEKTRAGLQSLGRKDVDFVIAHPPYLDIVKFTDNPADLSNISDIDTFVEKFIAAMGNGLHYLPARRYFAIVIGDIYRNSEVVPLAFMLMAAIKKNFSVKLKGIIVKDINGNRGKLGLQNIWRYRALRSDYYIFKHEYVLVFKKTAP